MADNPHLGRILADRYLLHEELGHGSMGHVYGAKDQTLGGVSVAVKFLSQSLMNDRMRDRFQREARICAGLGNRSIHIIRVTDYGIDEHNTPFYVMEYLRGDCLNSVIRQRPLRIPRFLSFCRQICLGLQRAHQGIEVDGEMHPIIHRDIKPSNIFITKDDTLGELVKILDFGIAKTLEDDSQQTKCFMGTLAYSSPEQMEGRDLDHRSDIYSLGIMLFQMLTGKMPLNADTRTFGGWYHAHREKAPRSIKQANPNIKIPKLLENLVMSCLAKEPKNRPQSVSQIIQELAPLAERYGKAQELRLRIAKVLEEKRASSQTAEARKSAQPLLEPKTPPTPEAICRLSSWPVKEKPIAEIVFPKIVVTSERSLATLWVMLPQRMIDTLSHSLPHNKFLFTASPHPTLLWLTVLYTQSSGPKWLPCYLDLKTAEGQTMLKLLQESKEYRILFFAKETPERCSMVQTLSITEPSPQLQDRQAQKLQEFGLMGDMAPATTAQFSKLSKRLLKQELEKLKPTIAQKLEAIV
ncbi:MAG: serine/threonine-protein kinase [Cyanobacteria bacterium P01_F01_bin.150]